MKKVLKMLGSTWMVLLIMIMASYVYAGVYEQTGVTPIDEMQQMMTDVTEEESFQQAYEEERWGMSLDTYRQTVGKLDILKSRFLQGPITFLTACLGLTVAVLVIQMTARVHERIAGAPKTRLMETVDWAMPSLLAEAGKYLLLALFAAKTGTLLESRAAWAAVLSVGVGLAPYLLNILRRKRAGRPVGGVTIAAAVMSALNLGFQMI